MPAFKAATLGFLLSLAGCVLLLMPTISVPVIKSIYFLSADVTGSGTGNNAGISAGGTITLGCFGYCFQGECTPVKLGYDLSDNSLLNLANSFIDLPNSLIKWLTYVLILHPVACGLAGISAIFGLLAHRRELTFTMTLVALWFSSLATIVALLAFIFDMVVFTIARSRINNVTSTNDNINLNASASYGTAIWLTLAGFLCLALSDCGFTAGRRLARARQRDRDASDGYKPRVDDAFAYDTRENARMAERRRSASTKDNSLPYFAEPETMPLQSYYDQQHYADSNEFGRANSLSAHQQHATSSSMGYDRTAVDGVGTGYGRRTPHQYQDSVSGAQQFPPISSAPQSQSDTRGVQPTPFVSMYDPQQDDPASPTRSDYGRSQQAIHNHRVSALPAQSAPSRDSMGVQRGYLSSSHPNGSYQTAESYQTAPERTTSPQRNSRQQSGQEWAPVMSTNSPFPPVPAQAYQPSSQAQAAAPRYQSSQAPTYESDDPHAAYYNPSMQYNSTPQPQNQFYSAEPVQRYSQQGPLALSTDMPQSNSREQNRSPVGYEYRRQSRQNQFSCGN